MSYLRKILLPFRNSPARDADCRWTGEPLDHPALASMTPHEMADLPVPAFLVNSRGKPVQVFERACGAGSIEKQNCA